MAGDELHLVAERLAPPWQAQYFDAVDSTQDEARAAAQRGAPTRSIFVADFQRGGRGRQGRSWLAPSGTALLLSIVFRETVTAPVPFRWTRLVALALAEAIDDLLQLKAAIKWPNDLMLNDRKLAGILAETSWDGHRLVAIVGVGVNVNTPATDLEAIPGPATSLAAECGQAVHRAELLRALLRHIDAWLDRPPAEVHAAWESRLWGRGQRLHLLDSGREEEVVVLGANLDGALRVRTHTGVERTTTTGELII
jgi:BirA family transcriptional regulator, biotin operon repressor / biotin---[acetyl-CoA-carboxylase] ligase